MISEWHLPKLTEFDICRDIVYNNSMHVAYRPEKIQKGWKQVSTF